MALTSQRLPDPKKKVVKTILPSSTVGETNSPVRTKVVLLDARTGRPRTRGDGTSYHWTVRGHVECLVDISRLDTDGWSPHPNTNGKDGEGREPSVLLVLTHRHEMFVLGIDGDVKDANTGSYGQWSG